MNIWLLQGEAIFSKAYGNAKYFVNPVSKYFNKSGLDVEQLVMSMAGSMQVKPLMTVNKGIANLPIMGPIAPGSNAVMQALGGTSIGEVQKSLKEVLQNDKIKALYMPVNSPGGNNQGIDQASELVREIAKKKPVFAQVMGENASAAYYMTSGANRIFSNSRTDRIGSIGTRLVLQDDSEMLQNMGIKTIVVDTGDNKSVGQSGVSITDSQVDYLQGIVNELQSFFDDSVQQGRPNVDITAVNDGSIFLAKQAQDKGLIDGIMSAEKSYGLLQSLI
jgi:protease-4